MRIVLADDSALARGIIKQALEDSGFQVIGQASNGLKAVELNRELSPDLIIMDINMPLMDGLSATREIMKEQPVPILVFSSEVDAKASFEIISCGALDIMRKPRISDYNDPAFLDVFIHKIRTLAGSLPQFRKALRRPDSGMMLPETRTRFGLVVMGASTGGPMAVKQILDALPADFSVPLILVQHLEKGFDQSYADWLQESCKLKVRLATNPDQVLAGTVLVAPVGIHLRFEGNELSHFDGPAVLNQKPAVDVLFKSAALSYGKRLLGVLLTGMGSDGAEGCVTIRENGGHTLVQDAASSAIYGMPKVAAELGGAAEILGLDGMAPRLIQLAREGL